MSHNVHTEIKKNVAHLYSNKLITEAAELREENYPDDAHATPPHFEVAGWSGPENGDDGDLIGFKLTKGIHTVNLVNSSQYNHVGEYEWTVYGSKLSVKAFLADIGAEAEIEKQAVVESWW